MNILFVSTAYPKRGEPTTGFPNYLYRVSLSLTQLGHTPIILTVGGWDSHRIEQGIEIWTVKIPIYHKYRSQTVNYALNALHISYGLNVKIKELLGKMHIDIIQFTSLSGVALFYHGKVPAILRLSSYAKTYFSSYQTYSQEVVKIMALIERLSSSRCNAIFSPCKKTSIAFGNDCGRNVKVIETPFVNDVSEYDWQYYDEYLTDKKYVLFFGTLYAEKGILVIAEILEKFLENNPDYYFVFAGNASNINGENAVNLLKKSAGKCVNRVIIFNALSHKQLYPIICKADFVVLPSLMENLSNACIEAMYFKKVVIGTDGASFEQLIVHGENGLLCQIGNSQDLFEKMQIAKNMSEREKKVMGELAKRCIDKLRPEYTVRKLIKLYEYVILNSSHR